MSEIVPITMPKWGLSMLEGTVTTWWKKEGEAFAEGEEIVDVETSKIANAYEAPFSGRLARIVAQEGEVVPVGGLIGISAAESVAAEEIDAFVEQFQANFVPESDEEGEAAGLQIKTVEVDGKSFRVGTLGDVGSANPVVLIHGFSGDLNNWLFNLDALQAKAPVVALELPGHGASSKEIETGSLHELADAMAGVLEELGVGNATLVGHSLGGAVAMQIAIDQPHLVRSLVLLAPAGLPGSKVGNDFVEGVVEAQSARQLVPALKMLFGDESLATRDLAEDMMKYKRLDGVEEALSLIARQMQDGAQFAELERKLADLPETTLIVGRDDRIVSAPDRSRLPGNWTVVEVASGHMPHMEQANEVNTLITAVLAKGG